MPKETPESTKKMFFTASDLLERINASIKVAAVKDDSLSPTPSTSVGGFELQRKMPDGSYRPADERELAAADFQAKMKQAAEMTSSLTPRQKIEWAAGQRRQGNVLFGNGDYKEAMDVYLTCLVAMDVSNSSSNTTEMKCSEDEISPMADITSSKSFNSKSEAEIQLPVLLNLALCALKLGMLSKAEQFCNYALELEAGQQSAKAYFRRGRIRMLLGNYVGAELDLDKALDLIEQSSIKDDASIILNEKQKLHGLVRQAEKNRKIQKKAMERLFQTAEHDEGAGTIPGNSAVEKLVNQTSSDECSSLYPEKKTERRKYSSLRDDPTWDHSKFINDHSNDATEGSQVARNHVAWCLQMMGRCAHRLLDVIGYDDDSNNRVTLGGTVHNSAVSILTKSKDI